MKKKQAYSELLLDNRWLKKRKEIIARDSFKCTKCKCKNILQVHHKRYVSGKKPWQYSNNDLITLCINCHKEEHLINKIKTYTKNKKPKTNRIERMLSELSKEDQALQLKYDSIIAPL